ncbi:MAG: tyrosine-type recombinase/integrase [Patescibacteria group bacterium]|nr:tyrosine-type recombinase/integrase [Patescibacteria group bacterium]
MAKLREARKEFINYLEEKNRAEATVLAYGTDIRQLIEYAEEEEDKENPDELTYEDLTGYLDDFRDQDYTKKSISRKINSIRTFFQFLKEKGYITQDPSNKLTHPKIEPKPPNILSETEYRALRDACRNDKRMYAIVELLLQTGIRIGELRKIQLQDIEFSEENGKGVLHIRPSHRKPARNIPLNQRAQDAIKEYLKVRPEANTDILFVTRPGNPYLIRNIRAAMKRYFKKAGLPDATINDLRHTFIAHQLKQGADVSYISKIVGHKRLTSTEKYLQYIERPEEENNELEEL